jgi:pimeloyl-ACP methyl ester carboxylesterase
VGHDWGAAVGWLLAGTRPERFTSYVALSLGHPYAYRRGGLPQLLKAWYIFLFLVPQVAERAVSAGDWKMFRRFLRHPDVESWITDLARPGRLTAALNWYRANALNPGEIPKSKLPVLGVWSSDDLALAERQMTGSARFVEAKWSYQRLEGFGHWFPIDTPEHLARILLDFFDATGR